MTVIADTPGPVPGRSSNAADHLWMHFTRMGSFATNPVPIIERGEGAYLYDTKGRRYLDALSGLFVVQVRNENAFRTTLQKLLDLPIVGDVRGSGYFWSVELVKDQATKEPFTSADCERILRGVVALGMWEARRLLPSRRPRQRSRTVRSPADLRQAEFDQVESAMHSVLSDAWAQL
jgi:adenosylmethionine-8-amino-7-oxononanoate aminotransferase